MLRDVKFWDGKRCEKPRAELRHEAVVTNRHEDAILDGCTVTNYDETVLHESLINRITKILYQIRAGNKTG